MLVLTRQVGDRIRIGDDVEIVVIRIRNDRVRIGIAAPDDVPVFRTELLQRTTNELPAVHRNGNESLDW